MHLVQFHHCCKLVQVQFKFNMKTCNEILMLQRFVKMLQRWGRSRLRASRCLALLYTKQILVHLGNEQHNSDLSSFDRRHSRRWREICASACVKICRMKSRGATEVFLTLCIPDRWSNVYTLTHFAFFFLFLKHSAALWKGSSFQPSGGVWSGAFTCCQSAQYKMHYLREAVMDVIQGQKTYQCHHCCLPVPLKFIWLTFGTDISQQDNRRGDVIRHKMVGMELIHSPFMWTRVCVCWHICYSLSSEAG